MSWIEFWDAKPTIYVSRRHKDAHYRGIADGLIAVLGADRPIVLDYGCGEARYAADVARHCRRLYLCEAAPSVRADLSQRFADVAAITVLAPEDLAGLDAGSVDLVVVNSVIQYLPRDVLDGCLDQWVRLIGERGRLLVADVIPRNVGPLTDAIALLRFGLREGFFIQAGLGLVRTLFSSYAKVRASLGLQHFDEAEMTMLLQAKGLVARRHYPNLGHNPSRMAFVASRPRSDGAPNA